MLFPSMRRLRLSRCRALLNSLECAVEAALPSDMLPQRSATGMQHVMTSHMMRGLHSTSSLDVQPVTAPSQPASQPPRARHQAVGSWALDIHTHNLKPLSTSTKLMKAPLLRLVDSLKQLVLSHHQQFSAASVQLANQALQIIRLAHKEANLSQRRAHQSSVHQSSSVAPPTAGDSHTVGTPVGTSEVNAGFIQKAASHAPAEPASHSGDAASHADTQPTHNQVPLLNLADTQPPPHTQQPPPLLNLADVNKTLLMLMETLPGKVPYELYCMLRMLGFKPTQIVLKLALSSLIPDKQGLAAVQLYNDWVQHCVHPASPTWWPTLAVLELSHVLGLLGEYSLHEQLLSIAEDHQVVPNILHHNQVRAYCNAGLLSGARGALVAAQHAGFDKDPVLYTLLINAYAKRGRVDDVLAVQGEMVARGMVLSTKTYNMIINACATGRRLGDAKEVFSRAIVHGGRSLYSFNTLLKAYAATHSHPEEAERVLHEMETEGPYPDVYTYTTMIAMWGRCQRPDKAQDTYDRMLQRGIDPSVSTTTALINAYGEAGWMQQAHTKLEDMIKHGPQPNLISFTSLLAWAGKHGTYEDAEQVYNKIIEHGLHPGIVTHLLLAELAMHHWDNTTSRENEGLLRKATTLMKEQVVPYFRPYAPHVGGPHLPPALDLHALSHYTCQLMLLELLQRRLDHFDVFAKPVPLEVVVGKGIRSTFRWQSKDLSCSVREFLSNLFAQTGLEEVQYAATNEGRLIVPGPAVHALFCALQSRGEKLDALDMHGYIVPA